VPMRSQGDFHGIVVEESLRDPSILKEVEILGRKKGTAWTLLRIGIEGVDSCRVFERIRQNLKIEDGVPFYAHFYRRGELIVVFPERTFRLTPEKGTWAPAVTYGRSVGIPADQLDFLPCRFEDETY